MKMTLFLPLLLVVLSVSTDQTEALALQQSFSPDVHAALREMIASLTEQRLELRSLKKESAGNAAKFESQGAEIEKLKKQLEVGQVAFSASLSVDDRRTYGPFKSLSTLVFRHVETNIGNAYNQKTGIFTAPVKGAYHFEWYIGAHGSRYGAGAMLMKNGERIFLAYEKKSSHFGKSSNAVTLLLENGDEVFVQQWPHSTLFDDHNHHTTFSGHLLFIM
ncbi:complement C1q tumor necrosis factor-related protein 3-like isoform X4 [Leuresthes tenuis]|uniref:complement C1q tumor necrosis factor-related protein 3-like isoform X4 n=1 Tax=Leuresthes tenuis TaxID=355514 RepID=UPI003B508F45